MDIIRNNIDEANAVLSLKIVPRDYEAKVEEVLKDYKKKVNLDGFRPGKVPFGLVRKMYGKSVLVEEVNKIISESLSRYFVEEKLRILGDPTPSEEGNDPIDWDVQTEFEFSFDIGIAPDFKVELSKSNKVPYYTIKIDKKIRDSYTEGYTRKFGSNKTVDKIEKGEELVKGNIKELREGGVFAEDTRRIFSRDDFAMIYSPQTFSPRERISVKTTSMPFLSMMRNPLVDTRKRTQRFSLSTQKRWR